MRAETVVTTACSARLNQMGKVWGQKCMNRRAVLNMSWQSMMSRSAKETVVLAPGCTLGGVRQLTHLHLGLAGGLSCSGSCALAAGCCPPLCGAGICCLNLPAQLHCVPLLGLSSPLCLQWVSLFLLAMPCLQWAHSGPTSLSLCPRHGVREKELAGDPLQCAKVSGSRYGHTWRSCAAIACCATADWAAASRRAASAATAAAAALSAACLVRASFKSAWTAALRSATAFSFARHSLSAAACALQQVIFCNACHTTLKIYPCRLIQEQCSALLQRSNIPKVTSLSAAACALQHTLITACCRAKH